MGGLPSGCSAGCWGCECAGRGQRRARRPIRQRVHVRQPLGREGHFQMSRYFPICMVRETSRVSLEK
ncbi:hypothetical protein ASNO1_45040 [Corallococcus caeni]|uniref:Uncharacterized protein n=1 Tax=Corallococcus caeni TaxID=3082388 RepID=A0ABQ6QX54_9BACT|nr:hypothetical protein ASNO1_45040 [Corallococcus sp. NO1]